ncbi:T9SS type A sorting domain-containing protein, partial [Lacinutrix salivirga]
QIQAEADCVDAIRLCDANISTYFVVDGSGAIDDANGSFTLACQNQTSASQWESDSAWFKFTPKYSGQLGFYICPDLEEDWEFIVFGPNADCSDLNNATWISCNTVGIGNSAMACTGSGDHPTQGGGGGGGVSGFNSYLNLTANETYILFITPFVTTGKTATLTFQGELVDNYTDAFDHPDCALSVLEYNLNNAVTVSPNPFVNTLTISSTATITQLQLYNVAGQQVLSQAFTTQLDLATLPNGIYFLKL